MMPETNTLAIFLVVILFFLWKLDFIATILTLKNLKSELPEEFHGIWDDAKYRKSQQYEKAQAQFGIISSITGLTVLLTFWFIGGFGWVDQWSRSVSASPLSSGLIFIAVLYALSWLMSLPFDLYHTFVLEERFGFNKTTGKTFAGDQIKGLFLTALFGLPVVTLILWLFQSVEGAWVWAWISVTVISLLLTYLAPSLILPLFNKFEPLEEGELNDEIKAMARKCQFPLTEISVMDGSKRSAKANAFFTGFGKRKKIALYDTLVEKQTVPELVGVLAHEIGHFKCKHIIQRLILSILQTAVIFVLLALATDASNAFGKQLFAAFGTLPSNAVGLVLFMIIFKPASRIISILMNILSRKHEFEADAYAAQVQASPEPLISALKKLSAENLSNLTPHPWEVFLDYSHPPVLVRIKALRSLSQ
jgi:STE24 endopeptidase